MCKREILSQQCNNAHVMPIFVQKCCGIPQVTLFFPSCITYICRIGGCKSCIGVFLVHMRPLQKKIGAADIIWICLMEIVPVSSAQQKMAFNIVSLGLNRVIYKPTLMRSFQFSCPAVLSQPPSNFSIHHILNIFVIFPPTMLLNFVPT